MFRFFCGYYNIDKPCLQYKRTTAIVSFPALTPADYPSGRVRPTPEPDSDTPA